MKARLRLRCLPSERLALDPLARMIHDGSSCSTRYSESAAGTRQSPDETGNHRGEETMRA